MKLCQNTFAHTGTTMPKLCQHTMLFDLLRLASSEKHFPQVNEKTEQERRLPDALGSGACCSGRCAASLLIPSHRTWDVS